ncbi:TonB-dependent receptor [Dokdonella koreensis]|uniref:TonB-dependent receptor n=1 Tax=Dokdonella koreensis DS-123 TaxID=1300342 RepID=A0A160DTS5_9GAMM|nr:TonB-dependent receptor [Dokdonella koreensis]ANB17798.1 TonB-dependent receptor [Dokdonella koreensis DS-123]
MKGICGVFAVLLGCAGLPAGAAADAAHAVDYRIEDGDLGDALNAWASQSEVQIVYPPQLVSHRTTRGLQGSHAPQEALDRLLEATDIEALPLGTGSYLLRRAPARAEPASTTPLAVPAEPAHRLLPQVDVRSRPLHRIAAASSLQVTTITREQIQSSGYLSLFELLRSQPGIQVTSQPEVMGGNSAGLFRAGASGAAAVALRRLGAKATLMLVDGRRLSDYGLAADQTGGVADIGAIPLAMVERIDIVRDGAATLYGSEAMAGVIDITLRQRLDGGELSTLQGISSRGDARHRQVSAALGEHFAGGTDLLLMFDALDQDPLPGDQRDWYTLDRRKDGLLDARSVFSFPGNYVGVLPNGSTVLRARPGCPKENLNEDGVCLDDSAKATTLRTAKESRSLLGHVRTPLSGNLEAYADLRIAQMEQHQQSAPSAGIITNPNGPATTASTALLYYAFWDIGPIRQATRSNIFSTNLGLKRDGPTWKVDSTLGVEESRVRERTTGLVNREAFADLANRLGYQFDKRTLSPEIAEALAPPLATTGRTRLLRVSSVASGRLAGWATGDLTLDAGAQWRRESLRYKPDTSLTSDALLIDRLAGRFSAARSVGAGYARLGVPLLHDLQMDLGWRTEHDSRFGTHASPSVNLLWTPVRSLLVRAGATQGWRTPTLLEQRPDVTHDGGFSYVLVPASLLPCAQPYHGGGAANLCLLEQRATQNPALRPETSRGVSAGVIWEPSEHFSVGLDVYRLRRKNEIGTIPPSYALQHPEAFPGFLARDDQGRLTGLNLFRVNLGQTRTSGADLDLRWTLPPTRYGTFGLDLMANWLDELSFRATPESPAYERAGYANQPRLTAMAALRWSAGPWASTLLLRHTGSYQYRQYEGDTLDCPAYRAAVGKCSTPAFTLVNASVAYTGWTDWRLALGIANLLDHEPEYYTEASGGYNPQFDDPVGRYYWLSATWRF